MTNIQIAEKLQLKRKEKNVTQEELATFVGVTKGSVSKWERGHSYPDITLLPKIAQYFNITIDDLLMYEKQLTRDEIRAYYRKYSAAFATKDFFLVFEEVQELLKEHYDCFPLLLEMAGLYLNYASTIKVEASRKQVMAEALILLKRIKQESNDLALLEQAQFLEATVYFMLGKPQETITLLVYKHYPHLAYESIISAAHAVLGEKKQANEVIQAGQYQYVVNLVDLLTADLSLNFEDFERFKMVWEKIVGIVANFELTTLHPSILLKPYYLAAQGYMLHGDSESSLSILEKLLQLIENHLFPITLHGDVYFNQLEVWIDSLTLGAMPPRSEAIIMRELVTIISAAAIFTPLQEIKRFQHIVETLENITKEVEKNAQN